MSTQRDSGLKMLTCDLGVASEQVTEDLPQRLIPTDIVRRPTFEELEATPEDYTDLTPVLEHEALPYSVYDSETADIDPEERITHDVPIVTDPAESKTDDIKVGVHPMHQHAHLIETLKTALDQGRSFYNKASIRLHSTTEIIDTLIAEGTVFRDPR